MVLDIIKDRISIRRYTGREVTEEQIRDILDAAF